jgi:hypothetical protein
MTAANRRGKLDMKPFDVTQHVKDDAGNPVWFMNNPLDERYVERPGKHVLDGMLPPEEFEVRKALLEMKFFTDQLGEYGFLARILRRPAYQRAEKIAIEKQEHLRKIANSTPEHKAAIRRIVNDMPKSNGGREALASYIT